MLIFILTQALAQTTWTDSSSGLTYDWSDLQQEPDEFYKVIDYTNTFAPSTYNFNFDLELSDFCTGQPVTASETVEFTDGWLASCSILGRKGNQEVKSIKDGVRITFSGGDVCYNFDTIDSRKLNIDLICSDVEEDWKITQSTYTDYCNVGIAKNSPSGCGYRKSSSMFWVIIIVVLIAAAYFISKNHSISDRLSSLPGKEAIGSFLDSVKQRIGGIAEKAKSIGGNKNYEMV